MYSALVLGYLSPAEKVEREKWVKEMEEERKAQKTTAKDYTWVPEQKKERQGKPMRNGYALPEGVWTKSPGEIARQLKQHSKDYDEAVKRLNFYINRAGRNLQGADKERLQQARDALKQAYGIHDQKKEDITKPAKQTTTPKSKTPSNRATTPKSTKTTKTTKTNTKTKTTTPKSTKTAQKKGTPPGTYKAPKVKGSVMVEAVTRLRLSNKLAADFDF